MGSSLNWEMYTFNQPKAQPQLASCLTITKINPKKTISSISPTT